MTLIKAKLIFIHCLFVYAMSMCLLILFAMFLLNYGSLTISYLGNPSDYDFRFSHLLLDSILIFIFGLTHSIMARPTFKKFLKQYYDESLVRPIYLLISIITLGSLIYFWQPIGGEIYDLRGGVISYTLIVLFLLGWVIQVASSFQINHFHLFGLSQTYAKLKNKTPSHPKFSIPLFYKYVRHPIYTGWLMVFWFNPYMTVSHVFFALGMSIYIYIATYYEEKDLVKYFDKKYVQYRKNVQYRYFPMIL